MTSEQKLFKVQVTEIRTGTVLVTATTIEEAERAAHDDCRGGMRDSEARMFSKVITSKGMYHCDGQGAKIDEPTQV